MLLAFDANITFVDDDLLNVLIERITDGRLATIYEDRYQRTVQNSPQREIVLKALAEMNEDDIDVREVHKMLKEMDIKNSHRLVSELSSDKVSKAVLIKVRDGSYRFSDPIFKVYSRVRGWKF